MTSYQEVINFWFQELHPEQWFKKGKPTDLLIKERFSSIHSTAIKGELYEWRNTALGRLAEIIRDGFFRRKQISPFLIDQLQLT